MLLLDSKNVMYDRFLQDLFTNDTTDSLISGITWGMVGISEALAVGFIFIAIAINFAKTIIKGGPNTFNLSELSRVWILFLMIGLFPIIMSVPSYIADTLRVGTAGLVSEENIDKYQQYINLRSNYEENIVRMDSTNKYNLDNLKNSEADVNKNIAANPSAVDSEGEATLWNTVLNLFSFQNAIGVIISTILFVICQIIKMAILAFCISGSKVILCIGPMAVAFSILPWWKDKLSDWFNFYCSFLFTPVILNVIDAVAMHHVYENFSTYLTTSQDPTSALSTNLFASTAMDLTILFLYFGAFTITSKVVGSSDAGRIFQEGVNTMLRATGVGAMGAAAFGGSAAAGLAGNVAGAGKSALEK